LGNKLNFYIEIKYMGTIFVPDTIEVIL